MFDWFSHRSKISRRSAAILTIFNFRAGAWISLLLRAYEHDKPAKTPNFLPIDFAGPQLNELVFVSGHPGSTSRWETLAQLEFDRDLLLPTTLLRASELRGGYIQFGRANPSNEQLVIGPLNALENAIKIRRKLLDALHNDSMMMHKKEEESTLSAACEAVRDQSLAANRIGLRSRTRALFALYLHRGRRGLQHAFYSAMRACCCGRPTSDRSRTPVGCVNTREASLPRIEQQLYARVPVYSEVEAMTLSFSLQRMREMSGSGLPAGAHFVRQGIP